MNKTEINATLSNAKTLKTVRDAIASVMRGAAGGNLLVSDLADDIFGDVCVKLLSALASYDPSKAQISTYVATVARNTAIDALRSYRVHGSFDGCKDRTLAEGGEVPGGESYSDSMVRAAGEGREASHKMSPRSSTVCGHFPSPESVAINNQTRSRIAAYVSTLPARERDVWEAMRDDATADSAKEVCERHSMTVNAARIVLCRVRKNVEAMAAA